MRDAKVVSQASFHRKVGVRVEKIASQHVDRSSKIEASVMVQSILD